MTAIESQKSKQGNLLARLSEAHVMFEVAALLIFLLIWIVTLRFVYLEGLAGNQFVLDKTRELIDVYEAHMTRNLSVIDQTTKTVKYAYEQHRHPAILAELEEKELLPPKLIFTISIADRHGEIVASTASGKQASVARQAFYLSHKTQASDGASVDLMQDAAQQTKVQFSRRIDNRQGTFDGVVFVSVDPAYFTSDYDKTRFGDQGVLALVGGDGVYWAKRTGEHVTSGERAFKTPVDLGANEDSDQPLPDPESADRVSRHSNARLIYGYPLAVAVGLSKNEQLQPFQDNIRKYYGIAGALSALLAAMAIVGARLLRQLNESRKRTRKNQETYYAASEMSNDGIYVMRAELDDEGQVADFMIEDVNNRGAQFFGRTKSELQAVRLCENMPECRANGVLAALADVYETGIPHEMEWKNSFAQVKAEWLYRSAVRVEDGVVVVMRDITERKKNEERITHMAHHDALTGLPNRSLLADRLKQAMLRAKREQKYVAVAFLDLDNFKPVNDTLGHRVGDELLKEMAQRMVKCVRQTDTVLRLGGDEFVIIFGDQPAGNAALVSTLQRIRNAIAEPFYFEGNRLQVTCSMGLSRYPEDDEDAETLLLYADTAMYHAKACGRNNYQYYVPGMTLSEDRTLDANDAPPPDGNSPAR